MDAERTEYEPPSGTKERTERARKYMIVREGELRDVLAFQIFKTRFT